MFRRKVTRVIVILLVGILTLAILTGCGGGGGLVGTWEYRGEFEFFGEIQEFVVRYEFFSDGTVLVDGVTGSWRADGNRLNMSIGRESGTVDFRISGNTLTIGSGGDTMTLTRVR